MTYYRKVRIWDTSNRTGDYSPSQSFRVGPPDTSLASPPNFELERAVPQSFRKQSNGTYFADFGKDAFATLAITYNAPKADTLLVRLGEQLAGNQINRKPEGHIRYQEIKLPVQPGRCTY